MVMKRFVILALLFLNSYAAVFAQANIGGFVYLDENQNLQDEIQETGQFASRENAGAP